MHYLQLFYFSIIDNDLAYNLLCKALAPRRCLNGLENKLSRWSLKIIGPSYSAALFPTPLKKNPTPLAERREHHLSNPDKKLSLSLSLLLSSARRRKPRGKQAKEEERERGRKRLASLNSN